MVLLGSCFFYACSYDILRPHPKQGNFGYLMLQLNLYLPALAYLPLRYTARNDVPI